MANPGADIEDVETEDLGLPQSEMGTNEYLRFFPQPWPSDQLPPPTASLLSIAPKKGILAAAGPDSLVIVRTDDLREQYIPNRRQKDISKGIHEDEPKIKSLVPQASIQIPRVSHVAFSADESCLVIVAEQGGGLAVYDTTSLSTNAKPAFQLGTNGTSVRHLIPNPTPTSDLARFFAIVLSNGQLLLADLQERKIVPAASGSPVFREQVCCAAWSKLGKQIIAGLEDGTAVQMDRSGVVKDTMPQPPQLARLRQDIYDGAAALPITSIAWLSNNEFLIIYSPVNPPPGEDLAPTDDSTYFFALREPKQNSWTFHKLATDPCTAFVSHRSRPAGHFIQRLNEWPPNLKDLLILSSSASVDIGVLTNLNTPDQFQVAVTMIKDETRRPTMPLSAAEEDTTPVGMVIDLSARIVPERPIPASSDTIENAAAPVPALCVLNTEGVFTMRWIVYNDSIRQNTPYPGIVHKSGPYRTYENLRNEGPSGSTNMNVPNTSSMNMTTDPPAQASAQIPKLSAPASVFGSAGGSTFGSASQPQQSAFGKPAFGAPAFGGTPTLGQSKSPWGASSSTPAAAAPSPAFGKPSFGTATAIGGASAFGQTGAMGANKPSLWGTSTASQPATPQTPANGSAFGNVSAKSPFSSFGSTSTTTTPFAAFAASKDNHPSGFASLAQKNQASPSPFGGQQGQLTSFGNPSKQSALAKETSMGSTATLGSTGSSFSFGQASAFQGSALGAPSSNETASFVSKPALSKEATMEDEPAEQAKPQGGGLLGMGGGGFKLGSLFKGDGSSKEESSKPKDSGPGLFGSNFGTALGAIQEDKTSTSPVPVKQEPTAETKLPLSSVPAFKPPSATPASAPTSKQKEPAKVVPEPAPLPPAWSATKPTPKGIPEDAPLPPFPSGSSKKDSENDPPLAGSPPVDLGNEKFSSAGASEEDGPDEEEWESNDEEESGDDEDDAEDDKEEEEAEEEPYEVEDDKALSAFKNRLQPPAPKPSKAQDLSTTPPSAAKVSFTPAGPPPSLRVGPVFPPPAAEPLRSPSPSRGGFRSVTSPVGRVSAGPLPSQIKQGNIPPAPAVQRPTQPAKPKEPPAGQLEDQAAAQVQKTISAPIVPNTDLPAFYTHHEYVGTTDKPGLAGQIERVYRDINSMIDVLGLNAWALKTFVEGHVQLTAPGERTRDDLEDEDAWTLSEVPALHAVVDQLDAQLQAGKLDNVRDTLYALREDERDVLKVKTKTIEIRKILSSRTDPDQLALHAAAPLSADALAQQSSLRHDVQKVQKLLAELESKMSVLRADLASFAPLTPSHSLQSPPSLSSSTFSPRVPTVEAVTRTIQRMTAMVQERSGDIDVLEAQIRALPPHASLKNSLALTTTTLGDDYEDDLTSRLANQRLVTGSPMRASTQGRQRRRMAANGDALGMSAMFAVPGARGGQTTFSPEASALARSNGSLSASLSASARKRMVDVTAEEVGGWNAKAERRRRVLEALKGRVEGKGVRVVRVE